MSMQAPVPSAESVRIQSVDYLRGLIMVLMAIDHVRVYAGVPAGGPEAGVFFTRWVTHFCAPGFVFLTGTSAFLYSKRNPDAVARFLFTRGLLLIVLEFTFIRFCWTFNLNYAGFTLAGVIWMLGCCMVVLAAMTRFKPATVGIIGLTIAAFQQLFALLPRAVPESIRPAFGHVWEFIYSSGLDGPASITILYVLVPWVGIMMAGYGFGEVLRMEPDRRNKLCLRIGLGATAVFLAVGSIVAYLYPSGEMPFLFDLLNQRKYPASQLFLLMTLGPLVALIPYTNRAKGWFSSMMITFGKVPMFYYLLHIPLIHISALIVNLLLFGTSNSTYYDTAPYTWMPDYQWSLPILYLVFALNIALLYFLCRNYSNYKAVHPEKWWLKYI